MSDDEVTLFIAFAIIAAVTIGNWYSRVSRTFAPAAPRYARTVLAILPALCLAVVLGWLKIGADASVRNHWPCILLMAAAAVSSASIVHLFLRGFGLTFTDNILERGNAAAIHVFSGFCLAMTALNIGANSGRGDSIYTTLIPLACGSVLLVVFAGCSARFGRMVERIVVERNLASGWRFGATLAILGGSLAIPAAGDWQSLGATLMDFGKWLPVQGAVVALACVIEARDSNSVHPVASV